MHIPTHILSGWIVGNLVPSFGPRERLNCILAASLADLDGLGFVFGPNSDAFQLVHHVVGHNIFFGLLLAGVLTAFSQRARPLAFGAYLVCFHLHLLMDLYGSGPGWAIHYLWPVGNERWLTDAAWEFSSWQNRVAFGALFAVTCLIGWRLKRTPLELLAPRLDARLVRRSDAAD